MDKKSSHIVFCEVWLLIHALTSIMVQLYGIHYRAWFSNYVWGFYYHIYLFISKTECWLNLSLLVKLVAVFMNTDNKIPMFYEYWYWYIVSLQKQNLSAGQFHYLHMNIHGHQTQQLQKYKQKQEQSHHSSYTHIKSRSESNIKYSSSFIKEV